MSRKPYVRPLSKTTWYMRNKRYRVYIRRELTSVLVAIYSFLLIYGLAALAADSPERWDAFLQAQQTPAAIVLHSAALLYFLVYQTFAWFELAPKAMPLRLGDKKVPAAAIVGAHYAAWGVLTALVLWFAGVF